MPGSGRYDAIVIGCGVMGASATYNLAKGGVKTLCLEQFGLNHDKGSSHGRTRIYRQAYYEDERYVPMLRRALDSWNDLEARSHRPLFKKTGGLMIGKPDGQLVSRARKSAEIHGLPHRMMTAQEVNSEFPSLRLGEEMMALREENAGFLHLEESVDAFVQSAKDEGAEFGFSEGVTKWERADDRFEVSTSKGVYGADGIVFCAGPWMTKVAGDSLPLRCERQVQFWFASGGEERFQADNMPIFISEEEGGAFYYGIPDVGHGVKVARSHGGRAVDPDRTDMAIDESDVQPIMSFAAKRTTLPRARPISAASCIYTNTPDMNFALGPLPQVPGAIVVSACSGHGFKFASVIGEIVAQLVAGRDCSFDISFLSPARFTRGV